MLKEVKSVPSSLLTSVDITTAERAHKNMKYKEPSVKLWLSSAVVIDLQLMKAIVFTESSLYFIFSPDSLRSSDIFRRESGRCHTVSFFFTYLSFHLDYPFFLFHLPVIIWMNYLNVFTTFPEISSLFIGKKYHVTCAIPAPLYSPFPYCLLISHFIQYWTSHWLQGLVCNTIHHVLQYMRGHFQRSFVVNPWFTCEFDKKC